MSSQLLDGRAGPLGHASTAQSADPTHDRRISKANWNYEGGRMRQGHVVPHPHPLVGGRDSSDAAGMFPRRKNKQSRGIDYSY
jgi:hypothetical protein